MTNELLIENANAIINSTDDPLDSQALNAEACEFLRVYGGKHNKFLETLTSVRYVNRQERFDGVKRILRGYVRYLEKGLTSTLSPERKVQIDTVSDYLEQADELLSNTKVHPAGPTVLIGASLEEFLRGWCNEENLDFQTSTIDGYTKALRDQELISKQDMKDITAWAGMRNDAAHGHWEQVNDKKRIKIMLESVNLFIKTHTQA